MEKIYTSTTSHLPAYSSMIHEHVVENETIFFSAQLRSNEGENIIIIIITAAAAAAISISPRAHTTSKNEPRRLNQSKFDEETRKHGHCVRIEFDTFVSA